MMLRACHIRQYIVVFDCAERGGGWLAGLVALPAWQLEDHWHAFVHNFAANLSQVLVHWYRHAELAMLHYV